MKTILRKRPRVTLDFDLSIEPSKTQQQFLKECDVNEILKKYEKTQTLNHVNSIQGNFGDFSNVTDYQSSLNAVMAAHDSFMGLSADIRSKFGNDPGNLIQFLSDDKNYDQAYQLGLLDSQKAQAYLQSKNPSQPSVEPKTTI